MISETTTFVILTHSDKVTLTEKEIDKVKEDASLNSIKDEKKRQMKIDELKEKKRKEKLEIMANNVATCLKMKDVTERIVKVSNYSKETAGDEEGDIKRNHVIDKQMCELWDKMLKPAYYTRFKDDKNK